MNKKLLTSNEMIVALIIIGLSLLIGFATPRFWGIPTLITLLRAMLVMLIFSLGEMLVILVGGIDVSFPAIASISFYATLKLMLATGVDSALFAFVVSAAIGIVFGVLNAVLICKVKLQPLIATLGVSNVVNGATLAFLGAGDIATIPQNVDRLSRIFLFSYTSPEGLTYSLNALAVLPVIFCFALHIILRHSMLGRGIYAIGGDENAARTTGFKVTKIKSFVYIAAGFLAGVGGMTHMILMRQANPSDLMGFEMMVIAAVVIGGARITGGYGSVLGTVLGVTLITLIQNNLIMLGVPTHFQTFVIGLVIVIGTSITSLRAKRIQESGRI